MNKDLWLQFRDLIDAYRDKKIDRATFCAEWGNLWVINSFDQLEKEEA